MFRKHTADVLDRLLVLVKHIDCSFCSWQILTVLAKADVTSVSLCYRCANNSTRKEKSGAGAKKCTSVGNILIPQFIPCSFNISLVQQGTLIFTLRKLQLQSHSCCRLKNVSYFSLNNHHVKYFERIFHTIRNSVLLNDRL